MDVVQVVHVVEGWLLSLAVLAASVALLMWHGGWLLRMAGWSGLIMGGLTAVVSNDPAADLPVWFGFVLMAAGVVMLALGHGVFRWRYGYWRWWLLERWAESRTAASRSNVDPYGS